MNRMSKPVRFKNRKTKKYDRFAATNNCHHPFVKQSGKKIKNGIRTYPNPSRGNRQMQGERIQN